MDREQFDRIWISVHGTAAKDRQLLCRYAQAFQQSVGKAVADALSANLTDKQRDNLKERLKTLADAWQQRVPACHFPSLAGTHVCVEDIYQELALFVDSSALPPRRKALPPVREPSFAEKQAIVLGYIQEADRQ